jgi:hypothetical protein
LVELGQGFKDWRADATAEGPDLPGADVVAGNSTKSIPAVQCVNPL